MYAAVEITWATTGTTVQWKERSAYAPGAQLFLAALALVAGGACLVSTRTLASFGRVAVATALILALPVFVVGINGLPIYFVTLATLSGIESATGLAQVLLNTVAAALLLLVVASYRRRLRGACPRCGQPHAGGSDMGLRRTETGSDLEVHWRIADSTIDSADFIAGIEVGFGQSLDKLAATLAADSHDTETTDSTKPRSMK
ncbi:hypothetical protein ACFYZ9_39740 [Streptomyces sp. NPDC001691]|uniref:hypothetical protein n=1 Tax=Streptomyces sp. NPDC001691 TaxID=3364600 RepID=UPI0036C3218D